MLPRLCWTHKRRSEDVNEVLDVFWTSYVRSVYVMCLRGSQTYVNNQPICCKKLLFNDDTPLEDFYTTRIQDWKTLEDTMRRLQLSCFY